MKFLFRRSLLLSLLAACFVAGAAHAACIEPAGNDGDIVYNSGSHTYQFCNGTGWLMFGGGSNCQATGNYSPTSSSGHGYFVLSSTTFNGNLGAQLGADALCLTELTTHTSWMGYSTANTNGQLVASKVHAFLCIGGQFCTNLMPLTTYYFANAANSAAGGASFTTDLYGQGPNDSANWSGASYFSGTYTYWSQRNSTSATAWSDYPYGSYPACFIDCSAYTSSSNSCNAASIGYTAATDGTRWLDTTNPTCDQTYNLICFVNP